MEIFHVEGGYPLSGEIQVAGNKNAALPVLAGTLLSDQPFTLKRMPNICDVRVLRKIIQELGKEVTFEDGVMHISGSLNGAQPNIERCQQIRASFALAGPLLSRLGRAVLPAPGGDRIGLRPLDTHIKGFEAMGVNASVVDGNYVLEAPNGLKGADIFLEEMSVLATENLILAAAMANGETILRNAASEPHVQDVCHLVVACGAHVEGIGTSTLRIIGQPNLSGATLCISADYIEVGSFIAMAGMMKSELRILDAEPENHRMTQIAFRKMGLHFHADGDDIIVPGDQEMICQSGFGGSIARIHDAPWPGFAPDLTSIAAVLATQCRGPVQLQEWMYESRFFWIDRLVAMGARIVMCDPHRIVVHGPSQLYGKRLVSPDIRAGMALLLAAMAAKGNSEIQNAQQIDRGYEYIDQRLSRLGAKITRESVS